MFHVAGAWSDDVTGLECGRHSQHALQAVLSARHFVVSGVLLWWKLSDSLPDFGWSVCMLRYISVLLCYRVAECRRGLEMRILSVCQTRALWRNGRKQIVQIFISHERSFSLVFGEEEWLVGRPLLPEILGQPVPVGAKSPILNR